MNYAGLTPYLVKAVQEIASITGTFKANLIAWLGSVSNGIGDFFAGTVHAKNELCIGQTCVPEDQLKAMLTASAAGTPGGGAAGGSSAQNGSEGADATITVNGSNPVAWQLGTPWQDNLGALFTHDGQSETIYSTSTVDTTIAGTTTLDYWALIPTSQQYLHTTRIVVIHSPANDNAQIVTTTVSSTAQ